MNYEDALKVWGAQKLSTYTDYDLQFNPVEKTRDIDTSTVTVEFYFDEGYACCGGHDPDCYCSMAESPRAEIQIGGQTTTGSYASTIVDASDFNFIQVLQEIVVAGGGTIDVYNAER